MVQFRNTGMERVNELRSPHRRVSDKTFSKSFWNLEEHGSFVKLKKNRRRTTWNDENTAAVVQQVYNNLKISLSNIKENTIFSVSSSIRITNKNVFALTELN